MAYHFSFIESPDKERIIMYMYLTTRRYLLASATAFVFVAILAFASTGFAQTDSTPSCSTNTPTVATNQSAVFTAYGGDGSYQWSGDNINLNNPTGAQFSVSYSVPGTYTIRVTSNGRSSTCTLTVSSNVPYVPGLPNTGGGYGHE